MAWPHPEEENYVFNPVRQFLQKNASDVCPNLVVTKVIDIEVCSNIYAKVWNPGPADAELAGNIGGNHHVLIGTYPILALLSDVPPTNLALQLYISTRTE